MFAALARAVAARAATAAQITAPSRRRSLQVAVQFRSGEFLRPDVFGGASRSDGGFPSRSYSAGEGNGPATPEYRYRFTAVVASGETSALAIRTAWASWSAPEDSASRAGFTDYLIGLRLPIKVALSLIYQ